jgi:hypothetical protein
MSFVFFAAGAAANRATMPAQPETAPVPSMEERLATAIQADEATANDLNEELAKVAQGYCGEIYGISGQISSDPGVTSDRRGVQLHFREHLLGTPHAALDRITFFQGPELRSRDLNDSDTTAQAMFADLIASGATFAVTGTPNELQGREARDGEEAYREIWYPLDDAHGRLPMYLCMSGPVQDYRAREASYLRQSWVIVPQPLTPTEQSSTAPPQSATAAETTTAPSLDQRVARAIHEAPDSDYVRGVIAEARQGEFASFHGTSGRFGGMIGLGSDRARLSEHFREHNLGSVYGALDRVSGFMGPEIRASDFYRFDEVSQATFAELVTSGTTFAIVGTQSELSGEARRAGETDQYREIWYPLGDSEGRLPMYLRIQAPTQNHRDRAFSQINQDWVLLPQLQITPDDYQGQNRAE